MPKTTLVISNCVVNASLIEVSNIQGLAPCVFPILVVHFDIFPFLPADLGTSSHLRPPILWMCQTLLWRPFFSTAHQNAITFVSLFCPYENM